MEEVKIKHKYLRRIILFGIALVIYILLTSTIYNATQEIKMTDYLIESTLYFVNIKDSQIQALLARERELTGSIDLDLAERMKGRIVVQVESNGEAWYIEPVELKRYYLGKPKDTSLLIKKKSKPMSSDEIINYMFFEKKFPKELAGRFIKNQDMKDEYYYILPDKLTSIKIGSPIEAFRFLKDQGIGILNKDIRKIMVGDQ